MERKSDKGKVNREFKIRNIDEYTFNKITEMAEQAGMKREAYLRQLLQNVAISGQVKAVEDKYSSLVETLSEYIQMQGEIIEQNLILMKEIRGEEIDV